MVHTYLSVKSKVRLTFLKHERGTENRRLNVLENGGMGSISWDLSRWRVNEEFTLTHTHVPVQCRPETTAKSPVNIFLTIELRSEQRSTEWSAPNDRISSKHELMRSFWIVDLKNQRQLPIFRWRHGFLHKKYSGNWLIKCCFICDLFVTPFRSCLM